MPEYREHGLYIVKDEYFSRFPNNAWTDNKNETRPYYYSFMDLKGIIWLVPLTTQVDNIKAKIKREEDRRGVGNCVYYHVGVIAGKERGFKIGDMFPVTEKYLERSFEIKNVPYFVEDNKLVEALDRKAKKYLNLVERGVIHNARDIISTKYMLLSDKQEIIP